ncbi:hypothetical protein [Sedimentitalea nanhaiensis]|uniref:Uncharacterized protein n=1 Tax=Sedimentitalea nanhaiensis TaxID=999627 RepID=A0A1I7CKX9_9RHOB|nr:hypothetical protein [Sedimentitalea nanhaiensis]SFU00087.1 hypothetical protein SAMN05216236_11780 [Sedimentitalea nanhaiensis]
MSDDHVPHPDDLLSVQVEADAKDGWFFRLWSEQCASQGKPDGTSEDMPLDYSNPPNIVQELKDAFDRFEAGNVIALLDALHICRSDNLPTPDWILSGMEKFILGTIMDGAPGKPGRSNNPLSRARQALKHEKQREVIRGIRNAQKFPPEAEWFHALALPNEVKRFFEAHGPRPLGSNLQDAVEIAEICLRGTEYQATFSTLERLAKSASEATYEISEQSVREALGLNALDDPPASYGSFSFGWPDALEGTKPESQQEQVTDTVKETAVFWFTVRQGSIRPIS